LSAVDALGGTVPVRTLVPLFALLACLVGTTTAVARPTQTSIVCGGEEEALPQTDENGILVEPDSSTEADRAGDYDDSAESQETPDEGVQLTPEELAALDACLGKAAKDAAAQAADAFDRAFNASKSLLLGTFGPDQLPYGGTVEFSLESGGATTARAAKAGGKLLGKAKLKLRSGDTKKLRFRLNGRGRKLLDRRGRVPAVGTLKLTDALSKKTTTSKVRVVLKRKR
jgi:hypothetical protein